MAKILNTVFQGLDKAITGDWGDDVNQRHVNSYDISTAEGEKILYKTTDKQDYEKQKLELQQNSWLNDRWVKANVDLSVQAFAGLNNVKLMYRDADLMDSFPEIGAALDIVSEESCINNDKGQVINVTSKSDRIRAILEDLFVNRLDIQVTAQMIVRGMCKYGNMFMMLNLDHKNGVLGWRQLPVFNVERLENGIENPYGGQGYRLAQNIDKNTDLSTKFIWTDETSEQIPFRNWQIAHFRLITNSLYLPYGCIVGDTRIETEFGYKEMSNIDIGDKVWTFNINSHMRELGTVTMFMPKGEKDVYKVSTFHNEIEGTEDHKLLIYEDNNLVYKEIKDLKIGDLLIVDNSYNKQEKKYDLSNRLADGFKTEKISKIEYVGKKQTYDFTVDNENSNFFANGIVTHNCSYLNAARRHWRMLSLMEDMMLIYRLERSIERRIYKIYVGAIDDADVQAYVQQIANNFKRTPIIDPMTGQIDLRKNIMPVHKDTPIPLLDGRTITIEELAKEFNSGKTNYVYSIQDKTHRIVPGKVAWCGKNYTADKLVKITFDDDSYCIMAQEHPLIMRDGSKKRADEVAIGESVMPFYRKIDKNSQKLFDRYEQIYNPNSGKFEFTHRLIGENVEKENAEYNTIHHKDFNKYNNEPSNLLWCDYFEHHKMHSELARRNWKNEEKRQKHIENLKKSLKGRIISPIHKQNISNTLKIKYANGELDYTKEINKKRIIEYNKLETTKQLRREKGLEIGYRKDFEEYNNSELHKQHDAIRRIASKNSWIGEGSANRIHKMNIHFDDFIWNSILNEVLAHRITKRKEMLDYINTNLIDYLISINDNRRLEHNHFISREVLENRIKEKGFATISAYITESLKNHTIKNIEWVSGDDVYCMTVVGLNGEDDRHNFALRTWNSNGSICQNGIFVSNSCDQDIFIPVRDPSAPTPIETLSAAQNLTALDDIKFVQNKVLTALRIPRTFLNFDESQGNGQNLALEDVRFTRTINRIQQAFLMELTKVASIHLYLLGFDDDLTNFSLSMNNPSTQAEQLEIENVSKKIGAVQTAVADPGTGIPIMSLQRALKQVMKWSDKEIQDNFEEIRLEKAIANELQMTNQIIKRTGIFDNVDRIYGEPGAQYQENQNQGGEGDMQGMGGGGMPPMGGGGGDFGNGLDELGSPNDDGMGEIGGESGEMPAADASNVLGGDEGSTPPEGNPPPMEAVSKNKPLLIEKIERNRRNDSQRNRTIVSRPDILDKTLLINEEFNNMISSLDEFLDNEKK